jgi:hypothetical protein
MRKKNLFSVAEENAIEINLWDSLALGYVPLISGMMDDLNDLLYSSYRILREDY